MTNSFRSRWRRPWMAIAIVGFALLVSGFYLTSIDEVDGDDTGELKHPPVQHGNSSILAWLRDKISPRKHDSSVVQDDEFTELQEPPQQLEEEVVVPEEDPPPAEIQDIEEKPKIHQQEQEQEHQQQQQQQQQQQEQQEHQQQQQQQHQQQHCDFYSGSWVQDEDYPLYQPFVCPFVDDGFKCPENGRTDTAYLKWRWQPRDCNLPRFDALDMLRVLKNKRLLFVGDSIGRNQWESLVCMLYQKVSNRSNVVEARGQHITKNKGSYAIKFRDYNVQIEFYRSHFLVRESRRPPGSSRKIKCALQLDKVDVKATKVTNAHVVVFNSGHWWNHGKIRKGKCYFIEGSNYTTKMDVITAYEKAMRSWSSWVDAHVDPRKTRVFFRGFAPSHFSGGQWDTGGSCSKFTQPVLNEASLEPLPNKVEIVQRVISSMRVPVTFLNVTRLSQFRADAHIANWGQVLKPGQQARQDCSHWCLPGVPDTWNQILYASLVA